MADTDRLTEIRNVLGELAQYAEEMERSRRWAMSAVNREWAKVGRRTVKALEAHAARIAELEAENERLRGPCICGPDSTGEAPDCRPDCPVHGVDAGTNRWRTETPF